MLVSLAWLRCLCPTGAGAEQIAGELTRRGLTVDAVTPCGEDTVFDVDIPANRPDCLGHRGLARELAAALGAELAPPPPAPAAAGEPVDAAVTVDVDDPSLCPRYTATLVRGVSIGPSPAWVAERLEACGVRPINNVVDASNLVLLELAQPIHTFDLARLCGPAIRVRTARPGETLRTLDGLDRALEPDMLVIADAERPVAVAGVMGGADSEIHEATTDVLVEAAAFHAGSVRRTARRLGMKTEASHRFERGVDPEGVADAQALAVRLLAELAGGTPAPGLVDRYPGASAPRRLTLDPARVLALLGFDPGFDTMVAALAALGLSPEPVAEGRIEVTVPSWRPDLERQADLVEEVARHVGYDRIPVHLPAAPGAPVASQAVDEIEESACDAMAHLGFHEAVNYAMIAEGEDDPFVPGPAERPLAIVNPIAEHLGRLRRSVLPGLIRSADRNLRRGIRDIRLFEVGRVFHARSPGELPREPLRLGLVWVGAAAPRHWSAGVADVGIYEVAGVVDSLLERFRPGATFRPGPPGVSGFHPGRSMGWVSEGGDVVARAGELSPALRDALDLAAAPLLAEIDLSALLELPAGVRRYAPLPRVPAVTRDLSLVLDDSIPFARVLATLRRIPAPAATSFDVIDRFTGPGLGPGRSSLTVRVTLQPFDKSLTDAETEAYRTELVRALEDDLEVRLRT